MRFRLPLRAATAASLAIVIALLGCAAGRTTVLRVQGVEHDALVTINDRYVGTLGELSRRGVALPPGQYRITVEKVGYFPHDELVEVGAEPMAMRVELVQVPD